MSRIRINGPGGPEEVHLNQADDEPRQSMIQTKPERKSNTGTWVLLILVAYFGLTAAMWNYYSARVGASMIVLAGVVSVVGNWKPWKD
jgi:hypothetical protein